MGTGLPGATHQQHGDLWGRRVSVLGWGRVSHTQLLRGSWASSCLHSNHCSDWSPPFVETRCNTVAKDSLKFFV